MKAKTTVKFQRIGLLGRSHMEEHGDFLKELKHYFEKRHCEIYWDKYLSPTYGLKRELTRHEILKRCNLVLTLGGDGTILKVVRDLPKRADLYILGVNLGNVGFHTEIQNKARLTQTLDEFFSGKYHIDERLMLRVTVYRGGKKIETHLALNEMVINQGNFARLISLYAEIDKRKMIAFKADGVIVATPSGSTGHSLSAGGPIIHPRIDAFIFTPICPAELSVRPIVIPYNRQLTISIKTERRYDDNKIGLTIDGQIVIPVEYGDQIKIRASGRRLRFIRRARAGGNYYHILREKLSWGKSM